MKKQLILLESFKKKKAYQFFFDWFEDSWKAEGGKMKNVNYNLPWSCRMVISKLGLVFSCNWLKSKRKALLILSGGYPSSFSFPFNYRYEIIPLIWDCWPKYWDRLFLFIKRNNVKILFVTSSQVRDIVKKKFSMINVYWIPEGIDISKYKKGKILKKRPIDLLELGRVMLPIHQKIVNSQIANLNVHYYTKDHQLLFSDFESLTEGLSNAKVTICYPRCYTHPEIAGNIETLTQRYWECMLSRTLIIGKTPKELLQVIGYNPVIEIEIDNVVEQLNTILRDISSYQELVDKNYNMALSFGRWNNRIELIKEKLQENGYYI